MHMYSSAEQCNLGDNLPDILTRKTHSKLRLHLQEETKEHKLFFDKRSSQNSSKKGSMNQNEFTDDDICSPQHLRIPLIGKQAFFDQTQQIKPVKYQSTQNVLPSIQKWIETVQKKQKEKHLIFKEEKNKNERKGASNQLISNARSTSDSKIIMQVPARKKEQGKIGKSRFASARKRVQRCLEQAVIYDVILYKEKEIELEIHDDSDAEDEELKVGEAMNYHLKRNFLEGHGITEDYRIRMFDWMIQVFRVLKVSGPQTYFLAVSILDRYCEAKQNQNFSIDKNDLYLLGLNAIFLSSKMEDVIPIRMKQIIEDAGHQKFPLRDIIRMERDILLSLSFNLQNESIYECAAIGFKDLLFSYKKQRWQQVDVDEALQYMLFICQLTTFSVEISLYPFSLLGSAIVNLTLRYMKRKFKFQYKSYQDSTVKDQQKKNLVILDDLRASYNSEHFDNMILKDIKALQRRINSFYQIFEQSGNRKNFERSYPLFIGEERLPYALKLK